MTTIRIPNVRRTSLTSVKARSSNPFESRNPAHDMRRHLVNKIAAVVVCVSFALAVIPLISLLTTVVMQGYARLSPYFLSVSMAGVYGGMNAGGIYHAIVGTVLVTGLATLISVPIGLGCAIYLVEYARGTRFARVTNFLVDVMTGIPSIVAGLFAAALFATFVSPAYRAGIMGAVALVVLMIPTVVRSSQEMLMLVPMELREASYALGVPHWRTIAKVVLRTAAPGLTTSIMLAIARVIGETAPLLMTVGVLHSINFNPFEGRLMTLPVYVYRQYSQGLAPCGGLENCVPTINFERAWAAALVLIIIVMILNIGARIISSLFSHNMR
ncbi:phosphate ABC transporter permease PstA [Gleimia hominis]|uniref:Phosphate transport system permease protein PstA n=1 Tax=Gleimia hominis TaxID=595468 RepID=A0ABU3I7V3_9ACTO|nr:phosphate ABC transporter permease PstA [Gleimia hominis]MDT3766472.1 phosphate ABC transporter permease PstA [Gleimia hominis]